MGKIIAFVLSLILVVALTLPIGCKKAETPPPAEQPAVTPVPAPVPQEPAQAPQPPAAPEKPAEAPKKKAPGY